MKIAREVVRHPDASMRCMQLRQQAFRGELHRHGHAELTWIEQGQGLRWVGDSVEPFFDGDLVLLGGEVPHLWVTRGPQAPGPCRATVLQFPLDWAAATGLPELRGVQALLERAELGLSVEGELRAPVQALLARVVAAEGPRRVAAFVELLALLNEGAAALRALATRPPPIAGDGREAAARRQRVDAVLRWIEAHLAQPLQVREAAAIAHLSPAAFGRFFRREVGKSFVDYVNDARCSWAALRLVRSRDSVATIAQDCGFPTLSNFGEQFRRRYGVSPLQHRKRAPLA